ncbi:phosphoglucomutase, alpha-D-glucose phosphate-specific [Carboxydocella sporoproducens DSM 16521]|uniref:Phosphoglucomutase n=2 Tax=Carboxydocella TaxID=178898 RepID=A0A1T4QS81_9FIRM|nr:MULTISPECIES: phosphoglucomutase/phosphomannomutase family protein [Carboxydocella]AVX20826.1 phosphoglucomutase, alpha-D-glucose phosphate-specific [Carboxydocella thermautotrophica]AVX31245.1 phosphoglucomutase, alpha-D-glucose phosphate-specific [Carboxydocella thermautotrophica]SKA06544.1 phosphoglucomutase, alpha-D-glucose phosphate-specific [Carboxydocella sporoproducens DSM 16521]
MSIRFGTDGWRAIMAADFTFANVAIVAQGIADYLLETEKAQKGIVLGHDTRFLAEQFADQVQAVLTANGIPVYRLQGPTPTPVTAYAIRALNTAGAIMLTASHNPPQYNGIKFIPEYAGPASPEITAQLEEKIGKVIAGGVNHQLPKPELVHSVDIWDKYWEHIDTIIDFNQICRIKGKIVLDPMFGAAAGKVAAKLQSCGLEVIEINGYRDAFFGGGLPEPVASRLQTLTQTVVQAKAVVGLANDGDADRFGVIGSNGEYLAPNQILSIISQYLLENGQKEGGLVRTVATTHLLDEIAGRYERKATETPVGFKYLAQEMLRRPVVLAGEESGGLSIGGHIPEKDGILANLLILQIIGATGQKPEEAWQLLQEQYGYYAFRRLDLHIENDRKNQLMQKLRNEPPLVFGQRQVLQQSLLEGVKLYLDDGSWVLFRPSGTEPVLRIYIEARSEQAYYDLIAAGEAAVK